MQQSLFLFLRTNWKHFSEMFLASFLVNIFALALPLFSMLIYDKAMGNQVHDTLWALAIGMTLILMFELVLRSARVYLVEHAGARWDAFLDERIIRGVLNAPLTRTILTADVVSRMREVSATRDVLSAQSLLTVADIPFVLLFAIVIALTGGYIVLIPLGVGALMVIISSMLMRASVLRQKESSKHNRVKISLLVDILSARESLYGRSTSRKAEILYRKEAQLGSRAAARSRWWTQINQQITPVILSLSSVAILVAGVYQVEAQLMSVGGLIAVSMLSMRFVSTIVGLSPLSSRWKEFTQALEGLSESVDLKSVTVLDKNESTAAFMTEGVRLTSLGFNYPNQPRSILKDINLNLLPGELVAVVGGTGAGKSTLLRVLAGQLPHTEGQFMFAANLIEDNSSRQWMCKHVQYKPQDPSFLGGNLREIISAGADNVSDDILINSLRQAGLGGALDRGEIGLNTPVSTNGRDLSGGQRQMVALATTFHGQYPLILLDEPTLGLDQIAQSCLIETLPKLCRERCVVIATHSVELILRADRMLVLDGGRIVADGNPNKLLNMDTYKSSTFGKAANSPTEINL